MVPGIDNGTWTADSDLDRSLSITAEMHRNRAVLMNASCNHVDNGGSVIGHNATNHVTEVGGHDLCCVTSMGTTLLTRRNAERHAPMIVNVATPTHVRLCPHRERQLSLLLLSKGSGESVLGQA